MTVHRLRRQVEQLRQLQERQRPRTAEERLWRIAFALEPPPAADDPLEERWQELCERSPITDPVLEDYAREYPQPTPSG